MKTEFVPIGTAIDDAGRILTTLDEVENECPWAAEIIKVEGGYRCFESVVDAAVWRNQK